MKFISMIAIVLAYGPVVFDLAVTGRGVNRPTQTFTTDPALTHFYTLQMGKPSLAIPPTGLAGGVLKELPGHNNQDSVVPIWTVYRITTSRALANIRSFTTNVKRRRLDREWRYIRSWWRSNSGRAIEEAPIVYLSSFLFLVVILTIRRKRVLYERRLEAKPAATLAQPSPSLANSVAVESLVRNEITQTTQRSVHFSRYTENANNIVVIGGRSMRLLDQLPRHLAFNFRSRLAGSTPTTNLARSIPRHSLEASIKYTFGIEGASAPANHRFARRLLSGSRSFLLGSAPTDLASFIRQQVLGAPTTYTGAVAVYEELRSGREGSNSRRFVVIALLVLPGGFVIFRYEAVDDLAFWTVSIVLNPGPSSSSTVSTRADNIYRAVPKRTVTLPTRRLIETGSPQSDVLSTRSSTPRRSFHSDGLVSSRGLLPPKIVRRGGEPLPSHKRATQPKVSRKRQPGSSSSSFTSIHSVEGVLIMACSSTRNGLHWSIQFYPFQHYHIVQHTDNDNNDEESIQAAASGFDIPLPDSRPESPEFHGPDGSPRSLDLYLYITALSHQYLSLRSMLVRPLLPEEARAIRAELRPRLGSLERRARERRGL